MKVVLIQVLRGFLFSSSSSTAPRQATPKPLFEAPWCGAACGTGPPFSLLAPGAGMPIHHHRSAAFVVVHHCGGEIAAVHQHA